MLKLKEKEKIAFTINTIVLLRQLSWNEYKSNTKLDCKNII